MLPHTRLHFMAFAKTPSEQTLNKFKREMESVYNFYMDTKNIRRLNI